MEIFHTRHWKRRGELHLAVGLVRAVLAVELSIRGEDIVKVTYRHTQVLEG
jgi:hypothetical protein